MDGLENDVDAVDGMSSTPGTGDDQASVSFGGTMTTAIATDGPRKSPSNASLFECDDMEEGEEEICANIREHKKLVN
jgi:hypothetical protein